MASNQLQNPIKHSKIT